MKFQIVVGIELSSIQVGVSRATWGQGLTSMVKRFLLEDKEFLRWKEARGFRVTETTLVDFPLKDIRRLVGADGLESITNCDGGLVLPILDPKIRRKMAAVFKKLSQRDRDKTLRRSARPLSNHESRVPQDRQCRNSLPSISINNQHRFSFPSYLSEYARSRDLPIEPSATNADNCIGPLPSSEESMMITAARPPHRPMSSPSSASLTMSMKTKARGKRLTGFRQRLMVSLLNIKPRQKGGTV